MKNKICDVDSKWCSMCGKCKKITDFWKSNRDGIQNWCNDCRYSYKLKKDYGLSFDQYQSLVTNQNKRCKICKRKRKLVVDHDHTNNQVRGLLCSECNLGLSKFQDDVRLMMSAAGYILDSVS